MEADAIHDDKIVSNVEQMQNQADKEVNTICRIQNTKRIYTILLRSIIVFYISQYYIQQCAVLFYIQQYSIYSSAQYFRLLYIVVLLQQYLVNAGPDRQKGEYYIYNIEYSTYIYCDTAQYYSLLYIIFTQYHYIQNTIILHTLLFTFCSICYSSKDNSKDSRLERRGFGGVGWSGGMKNRVGNSGGRKGEGKKLHVNPLSSYISSFFLHMLFFSTYPLFSDKKQRGRSTTASLAMHTMSHHHTYYVTSSYMLALQCMLQTSGCSKDSSKDSSKDASLAMHAPNKRTKKGKPRDIIPLFPHTS